MNDNIKIEGLEVGKKRVNTEYPSNSNKDKCQEDLLEKRVIGKVVTGKVIERKKSLGKKFLQLFIGEDNTLDNVIKTTAIDVLIPAAKSMLYDTLTGGFEMMFFGTTSGKRPRGRNSGIFGGGNSGKTYTSYNNISNGSRSNRDRDRDREREEERHTVVSRFNDVVMGTRGDAEEVLSTLADLVQDFGVASVADFYGMVGIPGNFTDNNIGWDDLSGVKVVRIRDGYILTLPKTVRVN